MFENIEEKLYQISDDKNWKLNEASNGAIIRHYFPYFREAVLSGHPLESKEIIQKYQEESICDNSGKITEKGRVVVISGLPLGEQCEALGIELESKSIHVDKKAETSALEYYIKRGYQGCYSEGMIIGVILYCLCYKKFFPLDLFKVKGGSGCPKGYISFDKYSFDHRSGLMSLIGNADEKIVKKNFNKILKKQYYYFRKLWESQGINEELVIRVYNALGNEEIASIAKLYFKDPFVYQKGWPDLAIVKDERARFIEVKTKDKLRRSQIITISDLKELTNLEFSVLRILPVS